MLQVCIDKSGDDDRDDYKSFDEDNDDCKSVQCATPLGSPAQSAPLPFEGAPLHLATLINEVDRLIRCRCHLCLEICWHTYIHTCGWYKGFSSAFSAVCLQDYMIYLTDQHQPIVTNLLLAVTDRSAVRLYLFDCVMSCAQLPQIQSATDTNEQHGTYRTHQTCLCRTYACGCTMGDALKTTECGVISPCCCLHLIRLDSLLCA